MTEITLPPMTQLSAGLWLGVLIEAATIAGTAAFAVTVRDDFRTARRRWFSDHTLALLHAADAADARNLPIFDYSVA